MNESTILEHAKTIRESVELLCENLEKDFPGITNKKYKEDDTTFLNRMIMILNFELIFAGVIK